MSKCYSADLIATCILKFVIDLTWYVASLNTAVFHEGMLTFLISTYMHSPFDLGLTQTRTLPQTLQDQQDLTPFFALKVLDLEGWVRL